MKKLLKLPIVLALLIGIFATAVAAEIEVLSDGEYQEAIKFHQQHGDPLNIRVFELESPSHQASLLGSTLMLYGGDRAMAERLMLLAIQSPEGLNNFGHGYTLHMLAELYQEDGKLEEAEHFYRQAISVDYEESCNNLGVMLEKQGRNEKALKVYEGCLPELATPMLLLNLGTLYYNGLGTKRDFKTGGEYWQQSYDSFAYEPDINYNLGLYHLRYSHDFTKARYHLALALALGDLGSLSLLREAKVFGEYADNSFADELRKEDRPYRRRWLIEDRLRYLHDNSALDGEDEYGLLFQLSDDAERITLTAPAQTEEQVERAATQMFWLIYVDQLSPISFDIMQFVSSLNSKKQASLNRYGWQHQATVKPDGTLHYEVYAPL